MIVQLDDPSLKDPDLHAPYRQWAKSLLEREWGGLPIVSRGRAHLAHLLPGYVVLIEDEPVGLATYRLDQGECELVSLNSSRPNIGVGTALLRAVINRAKMCGCSRVWLITTNDNLPGLRFYQRRGFYLVALYPQALDVTRKMKPSIPKTGIDGIPIRDEIELEMTLG